MALSLSKSISGTLQVVTSLGTIDRGAADVPVTLVARVVSINGNKHHAVAEIALEGTGMREIRFIDIPISVADGSPNFIAQAYIHLKSLPEFAGATDC